MMYTVTIPVIMNVTVATMERTRETTHAADAMAASTAVAQASAKANQKTGENQCASRACNTEGEDLRREEAKEESASKETDNEQYTPSRVILCGTEEPSHDTTNARDLAVTQQEERRTETDQYTSTERRDGVKFSIELPSTSEHCTYGCLLRV